MIRDDLLDFEFTSENSKDFETMNLKQHKEITQSLTSGARHLSLMMKTVDRLPLSLVGYSSNRWIKYVDHYLKGGPEFNKFLNIKLKPDESITFRTGGTSNHKRGECVLSITRTPKLINIHSRVIDWAGAGVLDMNLAWVCHKRLGLPVWFTCSLAKVNEWQLAGYKQLDQMSGPMAIKARKLIKDGPESLKFNRAARKVISRNIPSSNDEEEVVLNFTRITPEDLARCLGISGIKIRDVLRENFGLSTKGDIRNSHSWSSYSDPRFRRVTKLLNIDIRKLPSLEELALSRQLSE